MVTTPHPVDPHTPSSTAFAAELGAPPSLGQVGIAEASQLLGISKEGVRQRIRRGQLAASKIDGEWRIDLNASPPDPTGIPNGVSQNLNAVGHTGTANRRANHTPLNVLGTQLEAENTFLRQECERLHELLRAEQETRRREVSELHVLLQRAQAQIPMPTVAAQQQDHSQNQPTSHEPRRRRWWWPW